MYSQDLPPSQVLAGFLLWCTIGTVQISMIVQSLEIFPTRSQGLSHREQKGISKGYISEARFCKDTLYEINPQLASHGLEAQWGSGIPEEMVLQPDNHDLILGFKVLDIRERMLDAPNPTHVYRRLVIEAIELIKRYDKVVICCSAGVSRSNGIAVGVLVKYFGISFEEACKLVRKKVPIADISACHLEKLKSL